MKITLREHGGLAAAIRRPPRVIDTATLPADQAAAVAKLAAAAGSGPAGPGAARDAMSYEITIEDGGRQSVLRGSDGSMPAPLAELVAALRRIAR